MSPLISVQENKSKADADEHSTTAQIQEKSSGSNGCGCQGGQNAGRCANCTCHGKKDRETHQ